MSSSAPANQDKDHSKMRAPASTTKNAKSAAAASSKLHKRSRTGCFTCRLRRKKCDEGKPHCRACKHLGLKCEYKRPMWWSDGDSRRRNKETIKSAIRNTQVAKKNTQSPPGLCHSGPSSETNYDSVSHSRAPSVSTPFSPECMFTHQVSPEDYFAIPPLDASMAHQQYPMFSPFEVDIKTERQIFVNDIPTRRDSTISTFSTFQPPALSSGTPGYPADGWVQQEYFETQQETFAEEPVDFEFFQLPHGQMTPNHETIIVVDECDRPLLNHFIDKVSKLIFPILDANQHGSARSDIILPALESNKCYLHCCLSIAAIHMRSIDLRGAEQLDADTLRHRHATISELCEALHRDTDHAQILEATLGMIFFQCSVGRPQDCLPDIPWHQHFQAATELVQRLQLPNYLVSLASSGAPNHPPFNMTLTAWIDILGSTMLGRSPKFADTYRELIINNSGAGLAELMGCDDRIMFLISEIACLEARKLEGLLEEVMLCQYIEILGNEITKSEVPPESIKSAISATGAVRPKQLTINITCIFRIAARIYLCSMIPGYNIGQVIITNLINDFVNMMEYIPAGVEGFDRSLIWPLLVAGSASLPNSSFRPMFDQRCQRLGEAAEFGSFGRMREIFKDVWKINEAGFVAGDYQSVHWRNVMHQKEWDSLLI